MRPRTESRSPERLVLGAGPPGVTQCVGMLMPALQQTLDAQVVVQRGPVDAPACPAGLPVGAFRRAGRDERGIPSQRQTKGATVIQPDGELAVVGADRLNFCAC